MKHWIITYYFENGIFYLYIDLSSSKGMGNVALESSSNPATQSLPRLCWGKLTGRTLWSVQYSHLQVYEQRWEELRETVPAGVISENSANSR